MLDRSRSVEAMLQRDDVLQRLRRDTQSGGWERSHVPQRGNGSKDAATTRDFRLRGERKRTS